MPYKQKINRLLKKLFIQFSILIGLLILIEIALRLFGYNPGTIVNDLYPPDEVIYEPLFQADERGISSYVKTSTRLPNDYEINKQGFRNKHDYDSSSIAILRKNSGKKIIMLVGDSYTEGCCPQNIQHSFSDLLNQSADYEILNFGIGGTDLKQYQLIIEKYLPIVQPDLVVIGFYLGNDLLYHERPTQAFVPISYTFKNFRPWLNSFLFNENCLCNESNEIYVNPNEAYEAHFQCYTLWHEGTTSLEKFVRNSVLLSKLYFALTKDINRNNIKDVMQTDPVSQTKNKLLHIQTMCKKSNAKFLVLGIPSPIDSENQIELSLKYGKFFKDIKTSFPQIKDFTLEHYDGAETANHFNEKGHELFAKYAKTELEKALLENPNF